MVEGRKEICYLTTHSTHFIYSYMASDIWLRTILIARKETSCRHIGYSFRLTARVLLYAPSHRQDSTYHGLCYTSRRVVECRTAEALKPVQKNRNHKVVFNIMRGTKCRSVVQRPFMVRWVTGSLTMNPLTYFSFQPCSTTYVTKIVVCAILM